jgi:hypothetical protein
MGMTCLKTLLLCACVCLAGLLAAQDAPSAGERDKARRAYLEIRDNTDLFVGEGSAWTKDEGNDAGQAASVAAARARGSLAEAIEVRVQSSLQETQESSPAGASETVRSEASSSSDLKLENVQTRDFQDFPKPGQVTVLAWISKEDYRRQKAGKGVVVYRPENGIRAYAGLWEWGALKALGAQEMNVSGFDLVWRHCVIGGDHDSMKSNNNSSGAEWAIVDTARVGYEWTPLSWRLQPFVPVEFEYGNLEMGPRSINANLYAIFVGLGLRYWANDSVAIEFTGDFPLPLDSVDPGWAPTGIGAQTVVIPKVELSGPVFRVQLLWSAF